MIPSPREIFASFERGEIERDEMHAMMALHARELIQEMEDDYQNPAGAWIERLLAKRAAGRLIKLHGAAVLREVLVALADLPDFPPARYLWNAAHPDVPLHCFFRMRRQPVFKILSLLPQPAGFRVLTEHGPAGKGTRSTLLVERDDRWKLRARPL